MVGRCLACADRASRVTASVQESGAIQAGLPAELTCSGSEPSCVRWAASQSSSAVAWPCCPVAALNNAKKAVSAVQARPGVPGQVAPGRRPPSGRVRACCADLTALQDLGARLGEWRPEERDGRVSARSGVRVALVTGLAERRGDRCGQSGRSGRPAAAIAGGCCAADVGGQVAAARRPASSGAAVPSVTWTETSQ